MASRHVQSPNSVIPSSVSGNPDARIQRRTTKRASEQLTPTAVMWLKNPPRMDPEHALAAPAVGAIALANGLTTMAAHTVAITRRAGRRTVPPSGLGGAVASVMGI